MTGDDLERMTVLRSWSNPDDWIRWNMCGVGSNEWHDFAFYGRTLLCRKCGIGRVQLHDRG